MGAFTIIQRKGLDEIRLLPPLQYNIHDIDAWLREEAVCFPILQGFSFHSSTDSSFGVNIAAQHHVDREDLVNVVLLEAISGEPSAKSRQPCLRISAKYNSLPVLADDWVKVVTTSVILQFGNSDRSWRSRFDSSIGNGSCEPSDNVVLPH